MVALTLGLMLKDLAIAGFRPSLDACALCGSALTLEEGRPYNVSAEEGGVLCEHCRAQAPSKSVDASTLLWAHYLLYSPFDAFIGNHPTVAQSVGLIDFAQNLIEAHTGYPLKSLIALRSLLCM